MWRRLWRRLLARIRRDLIAGLLVIVPVGFTILAVLWILRQLDNLVLPQLYALLGLHGRHPPFLGVAVTLVLVLLAGSLTRSFVGRTALGTWERLVDRIPIARSLYAVLKQFMQAIFGDSAGRGQFRRVVLIEYPRRGIHSYAFVTGSVSSPEPGSSESLLKVFVPSTPNPTTGYFLLVPETEAIDTGLSVEEAFGVIISAGIATHNGEGEIPLIRRPSGPKVPEVSPEPQSS
ncbi:MAG: DUF502 domain-containing protein [Myxococcota bacterium]